MEVPISLTESIQGLSINTNQPLLSHFVLRHSTILSLSRCSCSSFFLLGFLLRLSSQTARPSQPPSIRSPTTPSTSGTLLVAGTGTFSVFSQLSRSLQSFLRTSIPEHKSRRNREISHCECSPASPLTPHLGYTKLSWFTLLSNISSHLLYTIWNSFSYDDHNAPILSLELYSDLNLLQCRHHRHRRTNTSSCFQWWVFFETSFPLLAFSHELRVMISPPRRVQIS